MTRIQDLLTVSGPLYEMILQQWTEKSLTFQLTSITAYYLEHNPSSDKLIFNFDHYGLR